jgi:AraC family ethanolamine operon transcriptional activator
MRSKKNVETTKLENGETLKKEFNNYVDMATSAVNWTLFCSYQLKPDFSEGVHKIMQLPSMQIAYTNMSGGIMFDYVAPKDCITFSVIKEVSQKACIDEMKLKKGMIVVTDDTKIYNLICSDKVEIYDISLNKNTNSMLLKKLIDSVDKYYLDKNSLIANLIENIVKKYADIVKIDTKISKKIEREIENAMLQIVEEQEVKTARFTKSEKIALEIKRELFKHMDGKMTIASLSKDYDISTKSLQNAFKSLFDLTPNQFIRILKLNLVHHELMHSNSTYTSVVAVANKWGFSHMGRLSQYYSELFGENPSLTLKRDIGSIDGMNVHCVERKEEIL